jgi:uncharacterized protein (TIGR02118 family)
MAKMVVLYKTPSDKDWFERHYFEVHIPLAKKLPGLMKYEINAGAVFSPIAHVDAHLIAILHFESMEAIKNAFASQTGKQCAADRKILSPKNGDVQIYLFDTKDV